MYDYSYVDKISLLASNNGSFQLTKHFQQKMNDSFYVFKFIRSYTDEISILKKGDRTDHVKNQELTLNRIKGKWLKCNILKSFFGQTEMEYLSFLIKLDCVKPLNRKIEAIKI